MVLMATMVVVGTAIGVGLYAGGGDFLSGMFSNKREGVAVQSPSAVTERPIAEVPAIPPSSPIEALPQGDGAGGETRNPAAGELPAISAETAPVTPAPRENTPPAPTPRADMRDEASGTLLSEPDSSPAAGRVRGERAAADRAERGSAEREERGGKEAGAKAPEKPAPKSGRYLVQVRATPDESEAKLIARRLRSRGAAGVAIVPSEKNGTTLYRVRFTSTGSDEAKELASKAGYGNVWVMKQK